MFTEHFLLCIYFIKSILYQCNKPERVVAIRTNCSNQIFMDVQEENNILVLIGWSTCSLPTPSLELQHVTFQLYLTYNIPRQSQYITMKSIIALCRQKIKFRIPNSVIKLQRKKSKKKNNFLENFTYLCHNLRYLQPSLLTSMSINEVIIKKNLYRRKEVTKKFEKKN